MTSCPRLIDDRIESDRCLTCLAVADDQLTLTAANRHHGIDRFDTGLQRLPYRLAIDNTWRQTLECVEVFRVNRAFTVDGLTQCVYHTSDHRFTDRNRHNAPVRRT